MSTGAGGQAGQPITRQGWVLFGLMGAIWGVPYLFIKVAVEHLSPPVVVFGRTSIAAVPLVFFAARADALRPTLAYWKPVLAFALLEMAIPWLLLTDAEQHLPSGLTGLLIACVPIVGAIVAFLLGDRSALRPKRLAGIAVGLAGVALLVAADLGGEAPWWSVVEVLLVCVGYATAPFIAARRLGHLPDLGVVAVSLSIVAVVYAPFAWIARPDDAPPAEAWAAVVALGVAVHGHRLRPLLPADRRGRAGPGDVDHVHQPRRRRRRRRASCSTSRSRRRRSPGSSSSSPAAGWPRATRRR